MRRPNRNVEIFSMSALDLFAAALGGFVLISVILFPNYSKQQRVELSLRDTEQILDRCKSGATELTQSLKSKDQQLAACEAVSDTTFLVVIIEWNVPGNYDVDLHITDPDGHEFSFDKNNRGRRDYPLTEAQLSYDNTRGPGIELWQHPKAQPGVYRISYVYFSAPGANLPVEVTGHVLSHNGRAELPLIKLTERRAPRPVARIIVGQRGNVDVQMEQ